MKPLISSVRIEIAGAHAHIGVWSRGGKAGTLIVDKDDAFDMASHLAKQYKAPIYCNSWKWEMDPYKDKDYGQWYAVSEQFPNWMLRVYDKSKFWQAYFEDSSGPSKVMSGPYNRDDMGYVTDSWNDCFFQIMEYAESFA